MSTLKAKVIWFNKLRGEGMVRGLNGEGTAEIYACNIPGKKTWYAETACVFYPEGSEVEVRVDAQTGFIVGVTPGVFDEAKWNSLDQDRLAFRCDENGKALNGLFAPDKRKADL